MPTGSAEASRELELSVLLSSSFAKASTGKLLKHLHCRAEQEWGQPASSSSVALLETRGDG